MAGSLAGTILSYLQTLIWPVVTASLVLYFLIRFRSNVANLLDRVTEGHLPAGFGFAAAPPPSQELAIAAEPGAVGLEILQAVVDEYEEQLGQEQQQHQQTVEQLTGALVSAQVDLDFERIYRLILGSQIRALQALRDSHPASVPRSLLEPIFEAAKAQAQLALASWTFEQWIGFLLRAGGAGDQPLVEQLGDGTYKITQKGLAFTAYIEVAALPPKLF